MNYENDPSWNKNYLDGYVVSKAVAVYDGDQLIWGIEP